MKLKKIETMLLLATGILFFHCLAEAASKPNVLYIYADDLGWGSFSVNTGVKTLTKTPTIDALVAGGINFRRGYGCPVCSPARSTQQTGFHQGHTWTDRNTPVASKAIRADDKTIGDMLHAAGYHTGYYGKWGYGSTSALIDPIINNPQTLPVNHGYTDVLAELHHVRAHTFFQPSLWFNDIDKYGGETVLKYNSNKGGHKKEYADDLYAQAAEAFIRTHANDKNPFFCEVAFQIPHVPLDDITNMAGWFDAYKNTDTSSWSEECKQYAAMLSRQDSHVAKLLAALDDPNGDGNTNDSVRAKTLIIFSSDNGGQRGLPHKFFKTNGNLRGTKGSILEGGIRVPTFFNWRGVIAPGQSTDHITCVSDILPTLCELAGIAPPVGIDGVSIAPLLTGKGKQRRRPWFTYESNKTWALIREDGLKLLGTGKLYRINDGSNTNYESTNLLADTSAPMRKTYLRWRDELLAIARAERVTEPDTFANTYHHWTGTNGAKISPADNWSNYTYSNNDTIYISENSEPRERWIATLSNTLTNNQTAILDTDINTLGIDITGNTTTHATQTVLVQNGKTLGGRNEIRLSPFAIIRLRGGTLNSARWINMLHDSVLGGTGIINATLYNSGKLIITPNNATGIVINGNYNQSLYATLRVATGSDSPLTVNGIATLNGKLSVIFRGAAREHYAILSATSINGVFSNPNGIVKGRGEQFKIIYTATTVEIEKISATKPKS